ncbi:hypothetical protein DZA01_30415, partial [Pseudomonas aeruginosa]
MYGSFVETYRRRNLVSGNNSLFRADALSSQQPNWLGEIVMTRPISFAFLTLLGAVMATLVVGFLIFGSYTKRSTVSGQLVPASGQVKVHA